MKLAATLIEDDRGKLVCVESGDTLQGQKLAARAIASKYGPGSRQVYVLYSDANRMMRKRVGIPDGSDLAKVWAEAKRDAESEHARRSEAMQEAFGIRKDAKDRKLAMSQKRRDAASPGGRKAKVEAKQARRDNAPKEPVAPKRGPGRPRKFE